MKLHTSIPPRRDGTVKVTGQDSQPYIFKAGEDGELSCDVTDEATLAWMLGTDNFYPADPADADRAGELVKVPQGNPDQGDGGGDGGQPTDEDDEPVNENALPVEANTPPAPARKGKAKAK